MSAMKDAAETPKRRPGRPLSFDRDAALHAAMLQFWRTGYETTSITDLTTAMGITAPSLYSAFGDKEHLFLECVAHYAAPVWPTAETLQQAPTARDAAKRLLEGSARRFTQADMPPGCLIASAATSGSHDAHRARAALKERRDHLHALLQARIQQDVDAGTLPRTTDAHALAALTVALMQGLSTLARDGATRQDLLTTVNAAMNAWPSTSA